MVAPAIASVDRTPEERAAAALELVGRDPELALAEADAAVTEAAGAGDAASLGTAHRAAALALRELGDLAAAETRLRQGIRAAVRGGATVTVAEVRATLAFVLLDRGRARAALAQADTAAVGLTGLPAMRVAAQRALVLHRIGRLDEAQAEYGAALRSLEKAGDQLWAARVHNNRGMLRFHRGALDAADADFIRAEQLYSGLGMTMLAAESDANRGNVAALRGDAPIALASFDRADLQPPLASKPKPQLLVSRCQVLLAVGMVEEARTTAEHAVTALRAAGREADLAEAQLLLATASLSESPESAEAQARIAHATFRRQGRPGWAMLANVVALRAAERSGAAPRSLIRTARDRAAELVVAGWPIAELDARLIGARAALRVGDVRTARGVLEAAGHGRRSGPLELRVRRWHAQALLRHMVGDRRGSLAALRAGLSLVEHRQAVLGATEFRVHVASFGAELAELGMELAIEGGKAREILVWAERYRARTLRLRPVTPPSDPELAEALADHRRLRAGLEAAQLEGGAGGTRGRLGAAEERVVRASRVTRSPLHRPADGPIDVARLLERLGAAALVEFIISEDTLLVVVAGGGRAQLHRLAPMAAVAAQAEAANAASRSLATGFGTERGRAVARSAMEAAAGRLDTVLFGPLRPHLGDGPIVLVPSGPLHSVPWGLLATLAARPVSIAPSAAAWLRAVQAPPVAVGAAVLVAGPGLAAAADEVSAIAADDRAATVLTGADATVPAVLAALDGARLAHVAAHGALRVDNPLFSSLVLADGPLTVYDLERLTVAPDTVVLPACQSGVSALRAGDEMLGLVSALLALGARTVVASVQPVSDITTAPLMVALHQHLRRGLAPAEALASVRSGVDQDDSGAVTVAASFQCFGA
ncbi:CHAT domain-containing protein [Pseudonocardia sp. GCM10023141]|uniref:CHAT domain-containing protein n=1 Tax=Pseudonocardia sp. GCM10023141 TaxID=3252653 RepID=UPI00360977DC